LFRWHKVQALKIDNVKLALDSTVDNFLWHPYGRYPEKCGIFYPNNEIRVPFKKDLELIGFESIEQYLPHSVSMQFRIGQDVPSNVARFNYTSLFLGKTTLGPCLIKICIFQEDCLRLMLLCVMQSGGSNQC
jgi:hypothetical protein